MKSSQKVPKLSGNDTSRVRNRSGFLSLSAELHDLIFEELSYIENVVNLSLTSQYFFGLGRRHIRNFFASYLGSWAGESIICVGDYCEKGDYPLSVLQDEEMQKSLNLDDCSKTLSLYDFASECDEVQGHVRFPPLFGQMLGESPGFAKDYHRMPDVLRDQVWKVLNPRVSDFYPKDQLWILRNLTIREYVRADAIAIELKPKYIDGPQISPVGFGEIIISRVCWSSDSSVAMMNEGSIHRGVWSGHRIDITTFTRHEQEVVEEQNRENDPNAKERVEWRDVSDEVTEETSRIWESEFGPDWRDKR